MKSLARILSIIFYVLEGLCTLAILAGMLFKSLQLPGGSELLMLGFSFTACVYFLIALTPYYKKYVSTEAVFQQGPILIFRRLFYFALGWLVLGDLFYILNLNGKEQLALVVLPVVSLLALMAIVGVALHRERRLVLQGVLIRTVVFLGIYLVLWSSAKPPTPY